jgi:hypothetical protein
MVRKHTPFPAPKDKTRRLQRNVLWDKLADTRDLEYAVLMAHVLLYDDLCDLLGARLRTDSVPERMPPFEAVMNLALAGSSYAYERETLDRLNTARNEVAHRTDRKKFDQAARDFAQRCWNNPNADYALDDFKWPQDERKRVEALWMGFILLSAELEGLSKELAK